MTSAIPAKTTTASSTEPGPRLSRDDKGTKTRKAPKQYSDRVRAERRLGWILAGPAFIIMLLVTLYPILQAIY